MRSWRRPWKVSTETSHETISEINQTTYLNVCGQRLFSINSSAGFTIVLRCAEAQGPVGQGSILPAKYMGNI